MKIVGDDKEYKIHQWANDWICIDVPNAQDSIVNPLKCIFTDEEVQMLSGTTNVGIFWLLYEWGPNNRLVRKKRQNFKTTTSEGFGF